MAALDVRYRGDRLTMVGSALAFGQLHIYSGLRPASPSVEPFGNNFLLGVVYLSDNFFVTTGTGAETINRIDTTEIVALRSGVMRWARLTTSTNSAVMDVDIVEDYSQPGLVVHTRVVHVGEPLFPENPPSLSVFNGQMVEGSIV